MSCGEWRVRWRLRSLYARKLTPGLKHGNADGDGEIEAAGAVGHWDGEADGFVFSQEALRQALGLAAEEEPVARLELCGVIGPGALGGEKVAPSRGLRGGGEELLQAVPEADIDLV